MAYVAVFRDLEVSGRLQLPAGLNQKNSSPPQSTASQGSEVCAAVVVVVWRHIGCSASPNVYQAIAHQQAASSGMSDATAVGGVLGEAVMAA